MDRADGNGGQMFDPKLTVAPVAKLLPVIVRYVRSVLLSKPAEVTAG